MQLIQAANKLLSICGAHSAIRAARSLTSLRAERLKDNNHCGEQKEISN